MGSKRKKINFDINSTTLLKIIFWSIIVTLPIYAGFSTFKYFTGSDSKRIKVEKPASRSLQTEVVSTDRSELIKNTSYVVRERDKSYPKDSWIKIEKRYYKLSVMKDNEVVKTYDIAIGKKTGQKQRVGDYRTPEGDFYVQQIQNSTSWKHDFKDGKGVIRGAYGPWFIRLKTGWRGIGIHGTHDPKSIGTNVTEGCIRLKNRDLRELKNLYIKIGLPVIIE